MDQFLIAVYGTLKKGFHNHDFLSQSKFIKADHTGSEYALFVHELPFLVKRSDGKGCEIEIYEVSQETLTQLDKLEGHPNFYKREVLKVIDDRQVYIYLYQDVYEDLKEIDILNSVESFI